MLNLNIPLIEDVLRVTNPKHLAKRAKIYEDYPNGVYYLHEGIVRVFRPTSFSTTHVDFYRTGELFGENSIDPESCRTAGPEEAIAHSECEVSFYRPEEIAALVSRKPDVVGTFLALFAARRERNFARLAFFSSRVKTRDRLCGALVDIARRIGRQTAKGFYVVEPSVSHETLAEIIGTTREVVTIGMNKLKREGLVAYDRQRLTVDADGLAEQLWPTPAGKTAA